MMTKLATSLAVLLGAMAATSGAMAADLILIEEAAIESATSNWDGLYAGAGVTFQSSTTSTETIFGVQGLVGANATFDSFLLGAEGYLTYMWSSSGSSFWGVGGTVRGGVLATEDVLIYAALGGEVVEGGNTYATVGGGVEFMATENVSLDLEYKYYIGLNNGWEGHHVGISANWHF
jgi:opacity protein-like surface antigen